MGLPMTWATRCKYCGQLAGFAERAGDHRPKGGSRPTIHRHGRSNRDEGCGRARRDQRLRLHDEHEVGLCVAHGVRCAAPPPHPQDTVGGSLMRPQRVLMAGAFTFRRLVVMVLTVIVSTGLAWGIALGGAANAQGNDELAR